MQTDHATRLELQARLRALKLRSTASRIAVLTSLHDAARPLSHAEVMDSFSEQEWDPATVYRILSDLTEVKLLRRMDLGDHVWRFELLDGCRALPDNHPHFLCTDCGAVTCLPEVELRPVDGQALPPAMDGIRLSLKISGQCRPCGDA